MTNTINCFSYIEFKKNNYPKDIIAYMDTLLVDAESKHVAFKDKNTDIFFELSKKVGYENTVLGIHRTASIKSEYLRIGNMSRSYCFRAVRFVITEDGRIWSDNTHWTLAYIYRYGIGTKISDIPFYIIDFRRSIPAIYDCDNVVFDSLADIKNAILAAQNIQKRITSGWRPSKISYTIGNLYTDMEMVAGTEEIS